jgi:acyl carrier protein
MEDLNNTVIKIIAKELRKDINIITLDTKFVDDLGADSLDMMEVIIGLEDEFGIDFDKKDVESGITVRDIVNEIEKLVDQKQSKLTLPQ